MASLSSVKPFAMRGSFRRSKRILGAVLVRGSFCETCVAVKRQVPPFLPERMRQPDASHIWMRANCSCSVILEFVNSFAIVNGTRIR